MRKIIILSVLGAGLLAALAYAAGLWPAHADMTAQARSEGRVRVYGNADLGSLAPLIRAFEARHPGIAVEYSELEATPLNARFLAEMQAGQHVVDLVWSSAMDLQSRLINDGYAQPYASPQRDALPANAVWDDLGYGVTVEPVAIIYNTSQVAPADIPATHAAFEQLLRSRRAALQGRVVTYDPAHSDIGYLYLSEDYAITRDTRSLVQALAATRPVLMTRSTEMVEAVASGRAAIGYNIVGAYALERARIDRRLGVVFPQDYTIAASRVAFIARDAPHPAAARLFLDYLLSHEGQTLLARSGLRPARTDVQSPQPPVPQPRPIQMGPRLFVNLDPIRRDRFLADWNELIAEGARTE